MSFITKWAFKNKAAVSIMSILIILMGVISYFTLPMEFFPAADQPQVSIVVLGQGTDSKTMEKQVTTPIEKGVSSVKGKRNIFSTTGDGYSKIDIHFESKTNMKEAKTEVKDALDTIPLPANVSKPAVIQLNTTMIPISELSITFNGSLTAEDVEFANEKIVPVIKDIKGVANVQTYGNSNSYISVKLDQEKLVQSQVSFQNVMGVLKGHSFSAAIGEKTIEGQSTNIKVIGSMDSLEKLKNLQVAPGVTLSDLAEVKVEEPQNTLNHINGEDGLVLIVTKDSSSNAVTISKEIDKQVNALNKMYDNAKTTVILTTAKMVENSVKTMMKEVLLGAFFATVVIMLFLRNIRSTFITIVSIPLSLCFTLFLLSRSGITLNILTLGGVAVAVGRLVDDSIVVIENIFRKMQKEDFSISMIIEATKEVGSAITSSTLTTVAVFLPIGLVNGGLQEFLLPFALTITYSLLASLIVALTVVPLMSAGLLKNTKLPEHKPAQKFTHFIRWSLNHKWIVLLTSFILFTGSIAAYFVMPKGSVDSQTSDYVMANLSYPNTTPLEKVKKESLQLENYLLEQEEVKYLFTQMGNSAEAAQFGDVGSPTETTFNIILRDDEDTQKLLNLIENQKSSYSDADLTVSAASLMGGASAQMTVDVMGSSIEEIEKTAKEIKESVSTIDGVETVSTNFETKKTVYSLNIDPLKGNSEQVAQQLGAMLNKMPIGSIELNDRETSVFLEPLINPEKSDDLMSIPVMTGEGMVPVSDVAQLEKTQEPTSSFHKDGNQYVRITAAIDSKKISEISQEMNNVIFGSKDVKGIKIPNDVEVFVGGASVQQADDFTDLFMTMLVSIGIVFLIMVITFKTIRAPIAILFSLPLAAIGAIVGLLVSQISVDVTALLGALMLIGIVVTNAIVLVDRIKQNEHKMIMREAIVEAAAIRMRPIVMTAVATISAMLPLLFKKAETGALVSQSLAIVVIGGLAVATLLTLIVIPVVYELFHFKKSRKQRSTIVNQDQLNM